MPSANANLKQRIPARDFKHYVCTGQAGDISIAKVIAEKQIDVQTVEVAKDSV